MIRPADTEDSYFNIGDTYYFPQYRPSQVTAPCPTCYGKLKVTVVLGNGESVLVDCETCGRGYEGPTGYVTDHSYAPVVTTFVIKHIHSMYEGEWVVVSWQGERATFTDLRRTYALAWEAATERAQAAEERNMLQSQSQSKSQRENLCWTIAYHEKCIKTIEKTLAWHRSKVSERKAKP